MSKLNLAAVSLVAAIPAGVLAFFSIYAFLNYAEEMQTMMQVVNGITLLAAVILILVPFVIMLKKGKGDTADKKKDKSAPVPEAVAAGGAAGDIDADPFELEAAGSDDALSGDLDAESFDDDALAPTEEEADLFEFDDEK